MQRERIADDIYVFISDRYAQVTATVIQTGEGVILFDTLLYPEETRIIKQFVETRLHDEVRYVINSHFHADHTAGTCLFASAQVVSHARCRELLDRRGRQSLETARMSSAELKDIELVLPDVIFDGEGLHMHVGGKTLCCRHSPGHSADSIVCLIKEDRVLLAADTLMPIPYFVDGSFDDFLASLEALKGGSYENVVQGHGEIMLRGEVEDKICADIDYLHALRAAVEDALKCADPEQALAMITSESCGKQGILLNGAVEQLHRNNVMVLAAQRRELMHV